MIYLDCVRQTQNGMGRKRGSGRGGGGDDRRDLMVGMRSYSRRRLLGRQARRSCGAGALIWGLAFSVFLVWYSNRLDYHPRHLSAAVLTTLIGATLTRLLVFHFKIRSPMY
jgi:hypothetical protein